MAKPRRVVGNKLRKFRSDEKSLISPKLCAEFELHLGRLFSLLAKPVTGGRIGEAAVTKDLCPPDRCEKFLPVITEHATELPPCP